MHPSTPRSPQWSPSLRLPHQDPIHPPLLTHTRHMPIPFHSRFYHPHNIGLGAQILQYKINIAANLSLSCPVILNFCTFWHFHHFQHVFGRLVQNSPWFSACVSANINSLIFDCDSTSGRWKMDL
jgi:hypothetical protein